MIHNEISAGSNQFKIAIKINVYYLDFMMIKIMQNS